MKNLSPRLESITPDQRIIGASQIIGQPFRAWVVDGATFEQLDRDLRDEGSSRADDPIYWDVVEAA